MYELRLTYSIYSTGVLLKYSSIFDAANEAAAIVRRAEPVNGEELMAIISKIPEAPEEVADSNEAVDYDDGSGIGQTFSP